MTDEETLREKRKTSEFNGLVIYRKMCSHSEMIGKDLRRDTTDSSTPSYVLTSL